MGVEGGWDMKSDGVDGGEYSRTSAFRRGVVCLFV